MTKVSRRKAVVTLLGSAGCLVGIPISIRLLPAFSEDCDRPKNPYQLVTPDLVRSNEPRQVLWEEGLSFLERPLLVDIEEGPAIDCCTYFGRTRR